MGLVRLFGSIVGQVATWLLGPTMRRGCTSVIIASVDAGAPKNYQREHTPGSQDIAPPILEKALHSSSEALT